LKILLIGKTGQLGNSLLAASSTHEIYAPERHELDIEFRESYECIIAKFKPNIVINTAAFHNVPLCEQEPLNAFSANCISIRNLAETCRKANTLFMTFSTDYVFGGEKKTPYHENDIPHPLQIYGISKLAGEHAALATAPKHTIIIRTSGLYGMHGATSKGGNFVDKRIIDAKNHKELEIGYDQVVSPTFTDDLAQAVLSLIEHSGLLPGIYHLVNEGECNWYEFTKAIYEYMNIDITVLPVNRAGMSNDMRRPLYSVLTNFRARNMLGTRLPHWRNALQRYIEQKYQAKTDYQQ